MFGGLFPIAFLAVRFGMFHYIHSVFLNHFFPVFDGGRARGFPTAAPYLRVLRDYWPFVLLVAVAERDAFRIRTPFGSGNSLMEPYKNVVRMHMLIFFFAFAHFAKHDNIMVYAVVYAVSFFPLRLVRRAWGGSAPAGSPVAAEEPWALAAGLRSVSRG